MADNFKSESSKVISKGFCYNPWDSNLEHAPCAQNENCSPLQSSTTEITTSTISTTENPPITSGYGFIIGLTIACLVLATLLAFCGYLVFRKIRRARLRLYRIEPNGTENRLSVLIENEVAGTTQNLIDLD